MAMFVDSVALIEYGFNKWYKLRDIMNERVRLPSEGCYVYAFRPVSYTHLTLPTKA